MVKWSDYGESSLTLLAVYAGLDKESPAAPRDPADFGRCIHLMNCLGLRFHDKFEGKMCVITDDQHYAIRNKDGSIQYGYRESGMMNLIGATADKYPCWKPFYRNWPKLMELWEIEKNRKIAPKLYAYIKRLEENNG